MGIKKDLYRNCPPLDRPLMASDIPQHFKLEESLERGMLPFVQHSENPLFDLKNYIARYMQQTIQMNALIRKIDHFYRFLEAISFSQSCVLNCNAIARECALSNKTVENYLRLLETPGLSFRLPPFNKDAKRLLSRHEKFYFFDAGVYQAIRSIDALDPLAPETITQQALSTLVAQHLRAWLNDSEKEGKCYFWRTKLGLEVDFIIHGAIGFYAIALKRANTMSDQDLKGLQTFKKDYPESLAILLYGGTEQILVQNILCIPIQYFLLNLKPGKPLLRLVTSRATLGKSDPVDA